MITKVILRPHTVSPLQSGLVFQGAAAEAYFQASFFTSTFCARLKNTISLLEIRSGITSIPARLHFQQIIDATNQTLLHTYFM